MKERDWALLNAFADGEVGGAEGEKLSARLEREPALAIELRRIQALKARVADLKASSLPSSGRGASLSIRAAGVAVAASLLIASLIGLALIEQPGGSGPQNVVLALHADFSASTDRETSTIDDMAEAAEIAPPDLSGSNLRLVGLRRIRDTVPEAIGYHYRGPRGCRLTLVVGTSLELPRNFDLSDRWTVGDRVLVLVADGMDPQRFAAIAEFAESATRKGATSDALRLALVERTAAARPCA